MKSLMSFFGGSSTMKYVLWAFGGLAAFFLLKNKIIPVLTGAQGKANPDTGTLHANVPASANNQTTALVNRIVPSKLDVRKVLTGAATAVNNKIAKGNNPAKKKTGSAAPGSLIRIAPQNEFEWQNSDVVPYIKQIPKMPSGMFNPYAFNTIQ